ncbi:MAG: hypothetical protein V4664_02485 [Patescibacteria group bacterium]
MLSIISSHKKTIIGIIIIVLLFIGYAAFVPKSSSPDGTLTRQNTTGNTGTASDPNSPGAQFVSQLLAIQNIHFNLDLFKDPAYAYLQDFSRELTPQEVGRDNPFAPLEGGSGSGNFVTESGASFVNTSEGTTSVKTPAKTTGGATRR